MKPEWMWRKDGGDHAMGWERGVRLEMVAAYVTQKRSLSLLLKSLMLVP